MKTDFVGTLHSFLHYRCAVILKVLIEMVIAAMKLKDAYSLEGKL